MDSSLPLACDVLKLIIWFSLIDVFIEYVRACLFVCEASAGGCAQGTQHVALAPTELELQGAGNCSVLGVGN